MVDELLIVESLFDALSYFERETPKISVLIGLFSGRARIRDGDVESTFATWLDRIAASALRRALAGEGCFFFVVRTSIVRRPTATTVSLVVEELRTSGGVVQAGSLRGGTLVIAGRGRGARIRELELSRGGLPAVKTRRRAPPPLYGRTS